MTARQPPAVGDRVELFDGDYDGAPHYSRHTITDTDVAAPGWDAWWRNLDETQIWRCHQ